MKRSIQCGFIFICMFGLSCLRIQAIEPDIQFTSVPPWRSFDDLYGLVSGVEPAKHNVAVYIYGKGWWTKPTFAVPYRSIAFDNTWWCDITTGGNDQDATRIVAFLFNATNSFWANTTNTRLGGSASIPPSFYSNALDWAYTERQANYRTLEFSGFTWTVKSGVARMGPGPNFFSDREDDVWVDDNGELHLRIVERNGNWYCSAVICNQSLGYGTYVFYVRSGLIDLDPNMVLGLFTWDTTGAAHNYREIDIEYSQWGDPNAANAQYVVQPYYHFGNRYRFNIDNNTNTTHQFTWGTNQIDFCSNYGLTMAPDISQIIEEWTYTGSDVPSTGNENPRINLWLMNGLAPLNSQNVEVVIADFAFLPLQIGSMDMEPAYELTWQGIPGVRYCLQHCTNLVEDIWENYSDPVIGTAGTNGICVPTRLWQQSYFRIQAVGSNGEF